MCVWVHLSFRHRHCLRDHVRGGITLDWVTPASNQTKISRKPTEKQRTIDRKSIENQPKSRTSQRGAQWNRGAQGPPGCVFDIKNHDSSIENHDSSIENRDSSFENHDSSFEKHDSCIAAVAWLRQRRQAMPIGA